MKKNTLVQTPRIKKILFSQKKIFYVIMITVILLPVVAAGVYYMGRSVIINQYKINIITPTFQTISPTPNQINQLQTNPTGSIKKCISDSDCPARQDCFLYQCFNGECRTINMCN